LQLQLEELLGNIYWLEICWCRFPFNKHNNHYQVFYPSFCICS